MAEKAKTILAVGGHVGDMELTAGGVLAAESLRGGHVVTLALTAGEKGAPAGRDLADYRRQKVAEAEQFAGMLGGRAIVLDYPDGLLPDTDAVRFQVCDVIREVKPDVIITHAGTSMHKDHMAAHRIVVDARFYASNSYFERELPAFFAPRLYFAENWEDAVGFAPYVYIDIAGGYALWQRAAATQWFAVHSTSFPYLEYYDHLSRVRGIEARRERAECFMVEPETLRVIQDRP